MEAIALRRSGRSINVWQLVVGAIVAHFGMQVTPARDVFGAGSGQASSSDARKLPAVCVPMLFGYFCCHRALSNHEIDQGGRLLLVFAGDALNA